MISAEPWELRRTMWVIQVAAPPGEATLLQAQIEGTGYVLCFTSDAKASAAIDGLAVRGAWVVRVPEGSAVELVAAVCQVGAAGIIVDLDPSTRKCAWSRRLTARA